MQETNETEPCNAPIREFKSDYQPYQKPEEAAPWGNLIVGTLPYATAMINWVKELQEEKGIPTVKAFVEAKKAGWQVDAYEMDDDVKEALELAGLIGAGSDTARARQNSDGSGTAVSSAESVAQAPITESVGLDEIIQRMQEESK